MGRTIVDASQPTCGGCQSSLYLGEGWELTFLIRTLGVSEELSNKVCFAFSYNGLKS